MENVAHTNGSPEPAEKDMKPFFEPDYPLSGIYPTEENVFKNYKKYT
jgi:hypothetical protein